MVSQPENVGGAPAGFGFSNQYRSADGVFAFAAVPLAHGLFCIRISGMLLEPGNGLL
jgi:hypothetical protein